MPRRRSGAILVPWLSGKPDCKEGRFIQVGNSLLLSKEFQRLSPGARMMYLCMAMEAAGRQEFEFPRSSAQKHGFSESTFARHIKELQDAGFIETVRSGRYARVPNIYRFSLQWRTPK